MTSRVAWTIVDPPLAATRSPTALPFWKMTCSTCVPVRTVRLGRFSTGLRNAEDALTLRPSRMVEVAYPMRAWSDSLMSSTRCKTE